MRKMALAPPQWRPEFSSYQKPGSVFACHRWGFSPSPLIRCRKKSYFVFLMDWKLLPPRRQHTKPFYPFSQLREKLCSTIQIYFNTLNTLLNKIFIFFYWWTKSELSKKKNHSCDTLVRYISIYAFEHSLQCKCFGDFTFFSFSDEFKKNKGWGEA